MAVTPEHAEAFVSRDFRDSDRWKDADVREVREFIFSKLPIRPRFKYEPYAHQWVCLGLGWTYRRYYFALDMGTGKSKILIDLFRFRRRVGHAKRMLVVVPSVTNLGQWVEQLREHAEDLTVEVMAGTKAKKHEIWHGDAAVVIATYSGVQAMCLESKPGSRKRQASEKNIREMCQLFDFFGLDECSVISKVSGQNFKIWRRVANTDAYMYLLSGTLFGKDPLTLWPQFYLIDRGWLLGKTLGEFQQCMFRQQKSPWGFQWRLRAGNRKVLHRMLRHASVRYSESECLDLPAQVGGIDQPMVVPVHFTDAQWRMYDAVQLDAAAQWEETGQAQPEAYLYKRRIVAGYTTSEDGIPVPIPGANPKLDALTELLADIRRDLGSDEKVVIVHHYQATGRLIEDRLRSEGLRFESVRGDVGSDGVGAFQRDPKVQHLVASRSAAFGLNLQVARVMIFFENLDGIEPRKQMERRIYRMGQDRVCYYYDLVMTNSVDESILRGLKSKKSVWQCVVEGENAPRKAR